MWYAVHVMISYEPEMVSFETPIVLEENVVLISAESREEVDKYIIDLDEMYNSNMSYIRNSPSKRTFLGVRKVIDISNEDLCNDKRPSHKSEITYELYNFYSEDDLSDYIHNKRISATYATANKGNLQI